MKRLIAAGILSLFIAAVYFSGNLYIDHVLDKSYAYVDKCTKNYNEQKNAEKIAIEFKKFWNTNEGYLSVFAHHSSIDEIEKAINSLVVYSKVSSSEIFYEYSETIKTLLHQLSEDAGISMHSIF